MAQHKTSKFVEPEFRPKHVIVSGAAIVPEIDRLARKEHRTFASMVHALLDEAINARQERIRENGQR